MFNKLPLFKPSHRMVSWQAMALLLSFGTPLIAALLLVAGQAQFNSNQNGQWLGQEYFLDSSQWHSLKAFNLVYSASHPKRTQLSQFASKVHAALGKKQQAVAIMAVPASTLAAAQLAPQALYVVDQRGLFILSYPLTLTEAHDRQQAKGLLLDLKKLLKYRRSQS